MANILRLQKTAELMRKVATRTSNRRFVFDMCSWITKPDEDEGFSRRVKPGLTYKPCDEDDCDLCYEDVKTVRALRDPSVPTTCRESCNICYEDVIPYREGACGTSACAVGHAMFDPWFIDQGLHVDGSFTEPIYTDGEGNEHESWDAVKAFYDLDSSPAEYLFGSQTYDDNKNPMLVAERIDEFIALTKRGFEYTRPGWL